MVVTLYQFESEQIRITVTAEFTDEGDLNISGYDIGESVKRMWGDADYEYDITVKKDDLSGVLKALKTRQTDLLNTIEAKFSGNEAFSSFQKFLDNHGIPYDYFTWA